MTTKCNKMLQKPLSLEQLNAIDILVQGKTDQETADSVGVDRVTVTKWRNYNPYFIAELNKRRKEIWQSAHDCLRMLVMDAVKTLEVALKNGDVKAAVEVLKAVKLYGQVEPPSGIEDPELILRKEAENWAESELRRQGRKRLLEDLTFGDEFDKDKQELADLRLKQIQNK